MTNQQMNRVDVNYILVFSTTTKEENIYNRAETCQMYKSEYSGKLRHGPRLKNAFFNIN